VARVVGLLGLLLGVQVIEVAVELVEAVEGREVLVAVAQVVLAVLGGHVALRLEQLGERRIFGLDALLGARHAHRRQAGAQRDLPGDERGTPGRAARLRVRVREQRALGSHPVDVGRPGAHDPAVIGADVKPAHVIGKNQEDVGLVRGHQEPSSQLAKVPVMAPTLRRANAATHRPKRVNQPDLDGAAFAWLRPVSIRQCGTGAQPAPASSDSRPRR
jgi:hypothetical protein